MNILTASELKIGRFVRDQYKSSMPKPSLFLLLLLVALFMPFGNAHSAVSYEQSLSFSTENQSMWNTGGGTNLNKSVNIGTEWNNKSFTVNAITGSRTGSVPNPEYAGWKTAYDTCRLTSSEHTCIYGKGWTNCTSIFGKRVCASPPTSGLGEAPSKYLDVDTRTGARLSVSTSGAIGLQAGVKVNTGTVNATAGYSISADLPDNHEVAVGQFIDLNPQSSIDSATLDTQSPYVEAYVNTFLGLDARFAGTACIIGAGCTTGRTSFDFDTQLEVASVDPNRLALFNELVKVPLAQSKLDIRANLTKENLLVKTGFGKQIYPNEPVSAGDVTRSLGTVEFQLPVIDTHGTLNSAGTVHTYDTMETLKARVDTDNLISTIAPTILPPQEVEITVMNKTIGGKKVELRAAFDAIDLDVGPTISLLQEFTFDPMLMAYLSFSNEVELADGSRISEWTGNWDDLPSFALLDDTDIFPTFWVDATLNNKTAVNFGLDYELSVVRAKLRGYVAGKKLFDKEISSLYSHDGRLANFGNIDVYNRGFFLEGFETIEGDVISLSLATGNNSLPATVPEPSTFALFSIGLFGLMRKKKGQASS